MADYDDTETEDTDPDKDDGDDEYEDDNEFVIPKLKKAAKNIAEQMTGEQRKALGKLVVDDTEADLESREADMVSRWDSWAKMYVGRPEQSKLSERSGAPNIHTPGSSVAVDQFSSRAEKYLLPTNNIAKAEGTGAEDRNRAWRVARFSNVQIEKRIPRFRRNLGTSIKQTSIFGMSAVKSWWDVDGGHPVVSHVPAEDFIIAYTHSGPLENAPRVTQRMRLTRDKVRDGIKKGIYCDSAWDLEDDTGVDSEDEGLAQTRVEIDGVEKSARASDAGPMEFYEQHRMLDLDGDGIGEPYVVTVHAASGHLLRVVSRMVKGERLDFFTELPFDYNPLGFYSLGIGAKTEGLNILQNSLANLTLFQAIRNSFPPKFRCKSAFDGAGDKEYELDEWIETKAHIEDVQKTFYIAPTTPPSPVLMTLYQEAGRQVREVVSVTDVMQGAEQPHNQAATTTKIIQQESMELFNGSFRRLLDALSELLTKLYQLNRLFLSDEEYIEVLGQTGQPEQAAWEKASAEWEQLTGQLMQMLDSGQMPPPELVMQLQQTQPPPPFWTTVEADFADDLSLIPTADPNLTTEQERLSQSEASLALVMQGPEQPAPRAVWAAKRNRLEALRVPAAVIAELLPEPEEPGPPPNLGPKEAIAALLKGQPVAVLPEQRHQDYLTEISMFMQGGMWEWVTAPAKEAVERHAQERVAALLEQEAKSGQQASVPAPPGGQQAPGAAIPGMPNMGGSPGGPMVPVGPGGNGAGGPVQA